MIGALPLAGVSIVFQVSWEMKKVAEVLRICLGKKWEGVGIEILGTKTLL